MSLRCLTVALTALTLLPGAGALSQTEYLNLGSQVALANEAPAGMFSAYAESLAQRRRRRASTTTTPIAFRVGAALGDNSGLLLGLDLGVPSISIGAGWTGRLDFDIWGFGDNDTNVAIILDQIQSTDGKTYFGFGLGVVAGDNGGLGVKLLLGTSISDNASLEFDVILADDVVPAIVVRIHL